MKMYSGPISPAAKRTRICAAELGVPLEKVVLDIQKDDHRAASYLALNPMGKFPTVVDGDLVLWESSAILCYLARKHAPNALHPVSAEGEADMLRWMFFGACHIDPSFALLVVERFFKAREKLAPDVTLTAHAEKQLGRFLPVLDAHLKGRDFVTSTFGLADVTLGCTIELSAMVSFDLETYANVRAWLSRLQARPSWRGISPEV